LSTQLFNIHYYNSISVSMNFVRWIVNLWMIFHKYH
jgi:hypothetical protein